MKHLAVRQVQQTGKAFVVGEVVSGPYSSPSVEFAVVIMVPEEKLDIVPRMPTYNRKMTAGHADRLINQG